MAGAPLCVHLLSHAIDCYRTYALGFVGFFRVPAAFFVVRVAWPVAYMAAWGVIAKIRPISAQDTSFACSSFMASTHSSLAASRAARALSRSSRRALARAISSSVSGIISSTIISRNARYGRGYASAPDQVFASCAMDTNRE